jgi:site-specific DNA-methyltransferase (adenine-specific)
LCVLMAALGPYELDSIHNGDCLDMLKDIPDSSIDLVVTDPPFAIDFKAFRLNYNRLDKNVLEGYQEVPAEKYYDFTREWMGHAHRVLKDLGTMYVFSGWNNLKDILNALDDVGFITINHLIWKFQFGVFTKKKYVTSHYHILFVAKEPKGFKFNKMDHYPEDVWEIKREYWKNKKKTPTKLPLKIVKKILEYSSDPGDIILDPFIGSGTVAVGAKELDRRFLGFEIVKEYHELALERLE